MSNLLTNLERFNRKERFFLIGHALGKQRFELAPDFGKALSATLDVPAVPTNAFVAMDYHLDWLYAALLLTSRPDAVGVPQERDFYPEEPPLRRLISGTQEDIDLLVAYEAEEGVHLILIE